MGLSRWLAGAAVRRVHVLPVEVPGWTAVRLAVEQQMHRRGWVEAAGPADTDLLVVCGRPESALAGAVDAVWNQMPGPRARADLAEPRHVTAALDAAATRLQDDPAQRADRSTALALDGTEEQHREHGDHGGHGEQGGHGVHGQHAGMATEMPGGIPMAERAPDRDGLALDVLHVRLGPVLPHWPAGLVLQASMQGDVLGEVSADVLPGEPSAPPSPWSVPYSPAAATDRVARLLAVAGWAAAAARMRRHRDELLAVPDEPTAALGGLHHTARRVRRSRTLRWMLRDLGVDPVAAGWPEGDAWNRLLAWLDEACGNRPVAVPRPDTRVALQVLPQLVTGLDLGASRTVVASLDIHTADAPSRNPPAGHPHG